jgi:hypothetical protein
MKIAFLGNSFFSRDVFLPSYPVKQLFSVSCSVSIVVSYVHREVGNEISHILKIPSFLSRNARIMRLRYSSPLFLCVNGGVYTFVSCTV